HLVAALVWTWAASRLGGIEAGAGAHAAGNLLLLTLLVTGVTLPASHGPAAFATLLLTDATTIAIVLLLARRLPRLTGCVVRRQCASSRGCPRHARTGCRAAAPAASWCTAADPPRRARRCA